MREIKKVSAIALARARAKLANEDDINLCIKAMICPNCTSNLQGEWDGDSEELVRVECACGFNHRVD